MKTAKAKSFPKILVVHTKKGILRPRRVGTLVALKTDDGVVRVGYAKCRVMKDRFDNVVGCDTALSRAARSLYSPETVRDLVMPNSMENDMKSFLGRASVFFKSKVLNVSGLTPEKVAEYIEVVGLPSSRVMEYIQEWKAGKSAKSKKSLKKVG